MAKRKVLRVPAACEKPRLGYIFAAILIALLFGTLSARADTETDEDGRTKSALTDFAISMVDTILGTGDEEESLVGAYVEEETSITFGVSSNSVTSIEMLGMSFSGVVPEMVNSINKIARNVAMVLLIAMFCLSIMQGYIDGNQYEEILVKKLVVFGVSLALMFYSQVICMELSNLGTGIVGLISGSLEVTEVENTLRDAIYEECTYVESGSSWSVENIGKSLSAFLSSLKYILVFLIPWLLTWISVILIRVTCISRALELIVLVAFAPFAFLSVTGHSGTENMTRFVRSFFAVCLQGAIIYAAAILSSQLINTVIGQILFDGTGVAETLTKLMSIAMLYVVEAGFISRTRRIAQMIVGN